LNSEREREREREEKEKERGVPKANSTIEIHIGEEFSLGEREGGGGGRERGERERV